MSSAHVARVPFESRELWIGVGMSTVAIGATVTAMGPITIPLCLGFAAACGIWWRRGRATAPAERDILVVYAAGFLVLLLHVLDEWRSGFPMQFPALIGERWSTGRFALFNTAWLAVFAVGGWRLSRRGPYALLIAWMFAIGATVLNGAAHIALSAYLGRLFPGSVTAPLVLVIGLVLTLRLGVETAVSESPAGLQVPHVWRRASLAAEAALFTIVVPGAVTLWIPGGLFGLFSTAVTLLWPWRVMAIAPLITGLLIYTRCVWEFAAYGQGIPAPVDHPKALVISGLYRYVRNPMYVGVLLLLVAETLWFPSWGLALYVAVFFGFIHLNVLVYEEPNLRRRFGREYMDYTARVSRWMPSAVRGDTPEAE